MRELKRRSRELAVRGSTEALIKACGMIDEELERPLVAVVNSWNELHPGHKHLREVAEAVKVGVRIAGGTPFETNTIALCDGIRSSESTKYILPSRELIADSIELVAETYRADAMVLISSCDKIEPANLMAAARVDIPTIIVTGGAMLPGVYRGVKITEQDKNVVGSGFKEGQKVSQESIQGLIDEQCGTVGSCYGMGTANTMACLIEAMGMSLPYSACSHAVDASKLRLAKKSGMAVVKLIEKGVKPSEIMTRPALENALRVNETIGGSTNTFLHLPALAYELGITLGIEDFDKISKNTPHLCNIIPSGPYTLQDLRDAGGIPAVMQELRSLLHMDAQTVTGETINDNIVEAEVFNREVIRPLSKPLFPQGGHAVLKGNLAPDGAVVKQVAVPPDMASFEGRARVFESMEATMEALESGNVGEGEILAIRYEGPKGGPGMREMLDITRMLATLGLEHKVALITDGRFSGYSRGCVIGHISPEAQEGGPIALVEDGDIIRIDIPKRRLEVDLSESEMQKRMLYWKPKEITATGYLKKYSRLVSSADKGAIIEVP